MALATRAHNALCLALLVVLQPQGMLFAAVTPEPA